MSKKPVALIIMDGFGYNKDTFGNAIAAANKPNIDKYLQGPHTLIGASGLDVGLPDGQMGNSEVGHTNIGAGRIVYQMLVKITKDIQDGVFFENKALCDEERHGSAPDGSALSGRRTQPHGTPVRSAGNGKAARSERCICSCIPGRQR